MFLIDTDVLSALRRRERHPQIARWMSRQRAGDLYLSVVSIGEIERGIIRQERSNPDFARTLALWLDSVIKLYGEQILGVNLATARRWGQLSAKTGNDSVDLLVAATALEHGLSVVTRNVRHFRPTGVDVVDPSAEAD
ncbi:MAG: type II toxin-antitoxin system VapC family toxin [Gammaproteobacteria bacterium]|nr:type II toxin-antitoxin system VapC family toxin [Gammaproteobacteria bacterium]